MGARIRQHDFVNTTSDAETLFPIDIDESALFAPIQHQVHYVNVPYASQPSMLPGQ
jgi:hypothetical protein